MEVLTSLRQPVQSALSAQWAAPCFGASGAGKDFSLRCERPGQEGLLLRALALIFSGNAALVAPSPRGTPQRQEDGSLTSGNGDTSVQLAYLLLTPDQTVHDLLSEATLEGPWQPTLERVELLGHKAFAESAQWNTCNSSADVMRQLTKADSARSEAQPREGSHSLIMLKLPSGGIMVFGSLASIDAMRGAPGEEGAHEALATSIEACGKCLEALSRSKKAAPPVGEHADNAARARARAGASREGVTTLLLCVHPSKRKLHRRSRRWPSASSLSPP